MVPRGFVKPGILVFRKLQNDAAKPSAAAAIAAAVAAAVIFDLNEIGYLLITQ